jgi:hypothetical protein
MGKRINHLLRPPGDGRERRLTIRRSSIAVVAAVLAIAGPLLAFTPASARATRPATSTESLSINNLADQIETTGVEHYASTFAGAVLSSPTTVTVYATSGDAALLTRLRQLVQGRAHLVVRTVPHSYQQLNSLETRISRAMPSLRKQGVSIAILAPDPATGTVQITLATPTKKYTRTAMAAMIGGARTMLTTQYGDSWVRVADATSVIPTTSSERDDDGSPWTGGDGIYLNGLGEYCTLGFTTVGNNSGNDYLLTAGHCGTGTVSSSGVTIGNVSTQYMSNFFGWDYDTIRANGEPRVWWGDDYTSDYYTIIGSELPAVDSDMTVDGDENPPQHRGNEVIANDIEITVSSPTYGDYDVGPVVEAATGACVGGDSGGPAYVVDGNTGDAWAVGTIDATTSSDCFIYRIDAELYWANLSLLTG